MFRNRKFICRATVVYTCIVNCVLHQHVKHAIPYLCIGYARLPEDEPSGSKHGED